MDEQMARAMAMADVGAAAAMCGLGGERVRVKRDEESGERGLYATADFGEGEPIGSVPVAACLLVDDTRASAPNVDDASAFARLHAPTAMETVLPWPVRAAAALLDHHFGPHAPRVDARHAHGHHLELREVPDLPRVSDPAASAPQSHAGTGQRRCDAQVSYA